MKQVGNMKLYSLEEVTDEIIGKKGTPERDDFDRKVEEALYAYRIGEAIRNARLKQNLTQEELSAKGSNIPHGKRVQHKHSDYEPGI